MTHTDLFPHLIANQLMKLVVLEPQTPSFPKWYNPGACYEYHARILGHSIEDCALFKHEVQRLIESDVLSFIVMEQLINRVAEEDRATSLTSSNSYINMNGNTIECLV
ncbi:hypothetical protein CRYUN_Cryun07bG0063800 [Craigia yunnanensis]